MVQSNGRFDFTYGIVEVRAKVPPGTGTWPAIWLVPENLSWPPEIDIMEYWGDQPDQVRVSLHYGADDQVDDKVLTSPDFADQYHDYAVDWQPGEISWYIDGKLVYRVDERVSQPMYPIMNLAVADPPTPAASTFPATFDIEWIRIYQQPGVGSAACRLASCTVPG
jgi:beta-glucanase (GH16 family)